MATGFPCAFAEVMNLPSHGLLTAGTPLRLVPAGAVKGPAAVSFPATLALGIPAAFLHSQTKSGRLVVVVVAAKGAVAGGSDDGPDREAAVSAFRLELGTFKTSQRHVAFVANSTVPSPLLEEAFRTANSCPPLVEFLLINEDVHPDIVKELGVAGRAFVVLEEQIREGYMRADSLVNCIQSLKFVRRTFLKDSDWEYPAADVPLSSDIDDKMGFFEELVDLFVMYYKLVFTNANLKYGFNGI